MSKLEKSQENINREFEENGIIYELVTVKVPKTIMNLLRYYHPVTEETPKGFIEYSAVEAVRSQIEGNTFWPDAVQLTNRFKLNPVFKEILNDEIKVNL